MLKRSVVILALWLWPAPALADAYSAGMRAMKAGNPERAFAKYQRSSRPEAAFQIGSMAFDGDLPACDTNCALLWLVKAAERGHLKAIPLIAALYFNDGQKDKAIEVMKFGARWNDDNSLEMLKELGQALPEPDLWQSYNAQMNAERERLRQKAEAESALRRQASHRLWEAVAPQIMFALGCNIGGGPLGCQTLPRSRNVMAQPEPIQSPPPVTFSQPDRLHHCPNGTYVYGARCFLAPNGTYTGAQPRLAPDGTYVGGLPRLAPNGQYVAGHGNLLMCPDGTYVAGSRCHLAPNGRYVGQ